MQRYFTRFANAINYEVNANVSLSKSAPASPRPMANDDAWTAELFILLKTVYYKSLCERLARLCYKNERLRRFEKSKKFPKMLFFGSWMAGSSEKKSSPTQAGTATEHKSFCVRPNRGFHTFEMTQ